MSDFTFILPTVNSDLLNSSGDNYYVKNVYQTRVLSEKLKGKKARVNSN